MVFSQRASRNPGPRRWTTPGSSNHMKYRNGSCLELVVQHTALTDSIIWTNLKTSNTEDGGVERTTVQELREKKNQHGLEKQGKAFRFFQQW